MELFIRLKNGQPFEHPILRDNFECAFPDVDLNNLPEWVARFTRLDIPSIGVYQVYEGVSYEWDGENVTDVHHVREMTNDEQLATQQIVKDQWAATSNFASWSFDEQLCQFVPPVAYPDDNKEYVWNESTTSWDEVVA